VLGSELRTWLQVDKFVRINNTAQAPTLRKILAEHASDNTNRRARLVAKLTELTQTADFYAIGQKLAIKSSSPAAQLDEQINYLIANSYPKLSYLKVLQSDVLAEIRATFSMTDVGQSSLNLNGEEGNAQAVKDVREYLSLAASQSAYYCPTSPSVIASDSTAGRKWKPHSSSPACLWLVRLSSP
jgi:hypothetical protein